VNRAAVQALSTRGGELYQARRYVEALRLFETIKSVAEKSGNAELKRSAWNNIGLCQFQLGRLDSAEAVFQAIMVADPTYVKAINNMAKVRLAQGRVSEAKRLFQRVLEIDPANRIAETELKKLGG
jgi:tetratricopeptide (TPR) repeat protein